MFLNSISNCFQDIALYSYWGHVFDLSGSRDVISHVTIPRRPFPSGGPVEPSLYLQRFQRYSTLNVTQWLTRPWYNLWTKVKVIYFGIMIMYQGVDTVQSLIWRIKFYNEEGKAHSLVRSLNTLLWSGHSHYSRYRVWAIRHSSKSLVFMRRNASCGETAIQRVSVSLSGSFASLRHYRIFYPRDAMLARVIATATCPSVRPSRDGIVKTKKVSVMISSPSGSPKTLVFWREISSPNSKVSPRTGASNKGRSEKFSDFLALSVNISKTVADTAKVTISDQ